MPLLIVRPQLFRTNYSSPGDRTTHSCSLGFQVGSTGSVLRICILEDRADPPYLK